MKKQNKKIANKKIARKETKKLKKLKTLSPLKLDKTNKTKMKMEEKFTGDVKMIKEIDKNIKKLEKESEKAWKNDYDNLERFFKPIDKIWEKNFGKMCPEFVLGCSQCEFALIYNDFKQRVFDKVLG